MESDAPLVKRPRVDIVPGGSMCEPPQLWVGTHRYAFDEVTALYFMTVLNNYIYQTVHRDKGPSFTLRGD